MSLCHVCLKVPFFSLPKPAPANLYSYVGNNQDMIQACGQSKDGDSDIQRLPDVVGVPFHENLETLALSAESCPLCFIVHVGVQKWINGWKHAAQNQPAFNEFQKERAPLPTKQPLVLSQCVSGPLGFLLWARNPSSDKLLYLLTAVGLSVEASSPWADVFITRPFETDSKSTQCLDLAASWMRTCLEEHGNCSQGISILPTRVLDVGPTCDVIRLIDGLGQPGQYACLSYCWGSAPPFTTSKESMDARRNGFHLSDAPQTFVDAVILIRHLGLRYIWIDGLCICQNDSEDWARESGRMTDIYSNAQIVIAASRSEDSMSGIFHHRGPRTTAKIDLPGGYNDIHATLLPPRSQYFGLGSEFNKEPLAARGWALQERVLARRVLHYTSRQIYFECEHGIVAEDGPSNQDRFCSLKSNMDLCKSMAYEADLDQWDMLIWEYGRRKLSRTTDKLPAMSGLAKLFRERLENPDYIAGLWSCAIIRGLSWQGLHGKAPYEEYTGPSWSWAGYDGIAANGHSPGWVDIAKVCEWSIQLKKNANPYGEVKNAWITIRGPVVALRPSKLTVLEYETRLQRAEIVPLPRFCTPYSKTEEGSRCTVDYDKFRSSDELRDWDLWVVLLRGKHDTESQDGNVNEDQSSIGFYFGLVVRASGSDQQGEVTMTRVGWMFLDADKLDDASRIVEDEENWRTIKLV